MVGSTRTVHNTCILQHYMSCRYLLDRLIDRLIDTCMYTYVMYRHTVACTTVWLRECVNVWILIDFSTGKGIHTTYIHVWPHVQEQFQYFAIKRHSVLQLNFFNSCRVPKKMVVDYYVCTVVQVVIF